MAAVPGKATAGCWQPYPLPDTLHRGASAGLACTRESGGGREPEVLLAAAARDADSGMDDDKGNYEFAQLAMGLRTNACAYEYAMRLCVKYAYAYIYIYHFL